MYYAINELLLKDQDIKNIKLPKNTIIFKNLNDVPKSETFFFSTIKDCQYLKSTYFGITSFYNLPISSYFAFIQNYFLNADSYFKLSCQLDNTDINKFCRSDSGNKIWSGQIIKDEIDLNFVKQENQLDTMMFLSNNKNISQEVRCWMINGKCIEISKYITWNKEQQNYIFDNNEYIKFAEFIASIYEPDELYTIDLGVYNNKIYIIEYNCFSTSGFYNANIEKIINNLELFYN